MQRAPAPFHPCPTCRREDAWTTVDHPAGRVVVCRYCSAVLATTARVGSHLVGRRGWSLRPAG